MNEVAQGNSRVHSDLDAVIEVGRLVFDRDLLRRYETPERGEVGRARFLVEPGNRSEVAAAAAWAYRNQARLIIQGANTGLVGASTPDASGTMGILGLDRLDQILDISPEDRTAVVEAGVRLDSLNDALAQFGLFFPIEVGSNPSIGGVIATNAGGARTIHHGDTASSVLGLEAVLADDVGSVIGQLHPLRKDNSSLRLDKLFIGSYGALGVITRASVGLKYLPAASTTALLALGSHGGALKCLLELEKTFPRSLAAFEFIDGTTMRLALGNLDHVQRPFSTLDHACYVLVEVVGDSDLVDLNNSVAEALDRLNASDEVTLDDAIVAPPRDLWSLRHSLSEGVRAAGQTVRFDVSAPRSSLPQLGQLVNGAFAELDLSPVISQFGHWADGGTHLQLIFDRGLTLEETERARDIVYGVIKDLRGSFSSEHGLGRFNAPYYHMYIPESDRFFERRIKQLFDPRGVWGTAPYDSP